MSVMVNTFPPAQAFNSRSWALLFIVTLHLGFFWALTSGLSIHIIDKIKPPPQLVPLPETPQPPRPPTRVLSDGPTIPGDLHPVPPEPAFKWEEDTTSTGDSIVVPPPTGGHAIEQPGQPQIVEPTAAVELSEPMYPAQEIRLQHTGTVLLSVQVLINGRVGEVRIDQSSGYSRLDASAVREARQWRFKPGTSDGVAVMMWKQVPITFRLN
jgi:protein TonB